MANNLYDNYVHVMMGGGVHGPVDLDTNTINGGILDSATYTVNRTTDQDWNDTGYGLNTCYSSEPTQTLANKVIGTPARAFDNTQALTFGAVATTGNNVDRFAIYLASGTVTTDCLIAYWDSFTPITPNNGDIQVDFAAGGVFSIGSN